MSTHASHRTTRRQLGARVTASSVAGAALLSLAACGTAVQGDKAGAKAPASSSSARAASAKRNGIEKRSASEIYNIAHKANAEAGSFTEARAQADTRARLTMSATECVGTVEKTGIGSYELVVKGREIWAKLDGQLTKTLQRMGGPGASLRAGTWLHGTSSHGLLKGLASYCHTEQFRTPDTASVKLSKGPVTKLDGQPVVPVSMSGGRGAKVTYYVATTGEPRLLKQASTVKTVPTLTYSNFGKPVGAEEPDGSIVPAPKG